jgi:spore germination protein GerM
MNKHKNTDAETEKWIEEIGRLKTLYHRNTNFYRALSSVLGVSVESPITEMMETNFENYVRLVSLTTGITKDALEWFIYENDCGDKGMVCVINEKEYKITGPKSFVEFEKELA